MSTPRPSPPRPPAPPTRARRLSALAALALAGLALAWSAPAGHADTCSACPPPSLADLEALPGFALETRYDDDGDAHVDTVQTDGGECGYTLAGAPSVTLGKSWTVLRGAGTVFNCPWGKSDSTVSISISDGDSTEWKVEGELSAELGLALAKLGGSFSAGVSSGLVHGEVRQLTQTITAATGHVLSWEGYFEIADLTLDATFDVTRRFAWWTKNEATQHDVHLKGDVAVPCGPTAVRMTRQASIGGLFHILDGRCDASVPPLDLGTFPRPRPRPETTPADQPVPVLEDDEEDDALPPGPQQPPLPEPHAPPLPPAPADAPLAPQPQESGDLPPPPAGTGPFPPVGDPAAEAAH